MTNIKHFPPIRKKRLHADTSFVQKANEVFNCIENINKLHAEHKFCDKWGNEIKVGDRVKWTLSPYPIGTINRLDRDYIYTEYGRWHWSRVEVVE